MKYFKFIIKQSVGAYFTSKAQTYVLPQRSFQLQLRQSRTRFEVKYAFTLYNYVLSVGNILPICRGGYFWYRAALYNRYGLASYIRHIRRKLTINIYKKGER